MEDQIRETSEQVAALIPRYSWEIMDEDQKDALMVKVVVKRYMKTTRDGVQLGPKWWAKVLGTSDHAIRGRVRRCDQEKPATAAAPSVAELGWIRAAKSAIRKHPELAEKLYDDPKVAQAVDNVAFTAAGQTRTHRPRTEDDRVFDLWGLFNRLGMACSQITRKLPDYVAEDDWRDEARRLANQAEATAEILRAWARGKNVADDADEMLAQWAEQHG